MTLRARMGQGTTITASGLGPRAVLGYAPAVGGKPDLSLRAPRDIGALLQNRKAPKARKDSAE